MLNSFFLDFFGIECEGYSCGVRGLKGDSKEGVNE